MQKILLTKRLTLRPFEASDLTMVHAYASDPDTTKFMLWPPNEMADTKAFLEHALDTTRKDNQTEYHYAVVLNTSHTVIGGCSLTLNGDEAEMGWILNKSYWHQGYAAELGTALIEHAFTDLNLRRLIAHCDANNTASYHLMERLGMRREGTYLEVRPVKENKRRSDEYAYALLKEEWDTQKEIKYYNNLACKDDFFIEVPFLSDGTLYLVCTHKTQGDPDIGWVPAYDFYVCKDGEKIGNLNLRIGYTDSLYYGGQIGYSIDEAYRGHGYAAAACRLLIPVAKAHHMDKLIITNHEINLASIRVCEKLGAKKLRTARLPEWHDLYRQGQRFVNIYEWQI